jgi:hypothetical protein
VPNETLLVLHIGFARVFILATCPLRKLAGLARAKQRWSLKPSRFRLAEIWRFFKKDDLQIVPYCLPIMGQ